MASPCPSSSEREAISALLQLSESDQPPSFASPQLYVVDELLENKNSSKIKSCYVGPEERKEPVVVVRASGSKGRSSKAELRRALGDIPDTSKALRISNSRSCFVPPEERNKAVVERASGSKARAKSIRKIGGGSGSTHIHRQAEAILKLLSTSGCSSEAEIRRKLGNSPDTSKALRMLLKKNEVKRSGKGGRKDPYIYMIA